MKNNSLSHTPQQANAVASSTESAGRNWSWWAALVLMTCLAFGFRYYYIVHAQVMQPVDQPNVHGDAVDYYNYARNLVDHGVFSKFRPGVLTPTGDSYRDPGYPLFLAAWLKISSEWSTWYAGVLMGQAVLSTFTVPLLVQLGRRWLPATWSLAAGVLMAVWPHSVAMSSYILTETLVGFLCAGALFQLAHAVARHGASRIFVSGVIFSSAALTNAVIYPFGCVACLWMWWRKLLNPKLSLCLMIGSLVLVVPWMLRNSQLPADSSSSTGRALDNLVQGSWPSYQSAYQAAIRRDPSGEIVMAAIYHETAAIHAGTMNGIGLLWHRMSNHPLEYAAWYASKPFLLWGWDIGMGQGDIYVYATRHSPFATNRLYRLIIAACHALNSLLFWCAAIGCFLVLFATSPFTPGLNATALLLVYVTIVYSALQVDPRYSVPFRGEEILMATVAVRMTWMWIIRRQLRHSALSGRNMKAS